MDAPQATRVGLKKSAHALTVQAVLGALRSKCNRTRRGVMEAVAPSGDGVSNSPARARTRRSVGELWGSVALRCRLPAALRTEFPASERA
eukprot:CAMPEP_0176305154 /NCGR_PEP_ID=MMETSP0121_2-20121125/62805_1 /TAXON_ID=160619 /ORGANISM="Kryptoperidinium foliaceum, Strain CCMP 1326" /LENGTH=89 /DNA_ID=CAMNT_0017646793 /DNA_START=1 /DNA_END=267 /DNA_ORIENTATION=-